MTTDRGAQPTYQNPIVADNCPDPAVVAAGAGGPFYAACTTNANEAPDKFPLLRSDDLIAWRSVGHLFPRGRWPVWARRDFWAPEIHRVGDQWIAYFTARDESGLLCVGAALAASIEGPWEDLGRPLLRDPAVGLIDAHLFQDEDGRRYLYWKEDGNGAAPPRPSVIVGQEVAEDGLTRVGEPAVLLANDAPWEGDVVEGPWVVRRGGALYMFYAGNTFNSDRYATGVARAAAPLGPFEKHDGPILVSNARWSGPGHGCLVAAGGQDYFVYHAWEAGRVDEVWDVSVHPRMMLLDCVEWRDGWPRIGDGAPGTGLLPRPRV